MREVTSMLARSVDIDGRIKHMVYRDLWMDLERLKMCTAIDSLVTEDNPRLQMDADKVIKRLSMCSI